MGDMNILLKDTTKTYNTNFTTDEFDVNPKDYIQKAVNKYTGYQFKIHFGEDEQLVTLKAPDESKDVFAEERKSE